MEIEGGFPSTKKTDTKLDLHQGGNFGGSLIFGQMKAKLTTKTPQHFAKLAEPAVSSSRQITSKMKRSMKRISLQLIPVIALACSALLYYVTGCSRAPEAPPKEVTIQADDKMRYDVTAFDSRSLGFGFDAKSARCVPNSRVVCARANPSRSSEQNSAGKLVDRTCRSLVQRNRGALVCIVNCTGGIASEQIGRVRRHAS
jgi:hypothetical protein